MGREVVSNQTPRITFQGVRAGKVRKAHGVREHSTRYVMGGLGLLGRAAWEEAALPLEVVFVYLIRLTVKDPGSSSNLLLYFAGS